MFSKSSTPAAPRPCTKSTLPAQALWHRCMQARPDFPVMYLGYHHYRGKGWIPRTGLQYGADYVLYQKHPALAHSDYAVLVVPQFEARGPRLEWHDLQTANRLSAQVWETGREGLRPRSRRPQMLAANLQDSPNSTLP